MAPEVTPTALPIVPAPSSVDVTGVPSQCVSPEDKNKIETPPKLAPVALRDETNSKVYELKFRCPGDVLEYQSLDGSVKYTKRDSEGKVWVPVKWDGTNWTPDSLQKIQLIYSAVLDDSSVKDKQIRTDLKSGDKEKIKSAFRTLGWGNPSGETDKAFTFTRTDTGARVTYYLSDDKKTWSTLKPTETHSKEEHRPAITPPPSVAFKVDAQGKVIQGVKHRAGADVDYVVLDIQDPGKSKSYAFEYISPYATRRPELHVTAIGARYGLANAINTPIVTLPGLLNVPQELPFTPHDKGMGEINIDLTGGGMNFRTALRVSDLNVPATATPEGNSTTGYMVLGGAGVINHSKSIEQEGRLQIMASGTSMLMGGALVMIDGNGQSHPIPIFLFSNEREVVRFQPNTEKGPAFVIGFRTETMIPLNDGGARNPDHPERGNWADLLTTKNALYFTVGAEWVFLPRTNLAGLLSERRQPDKAEVVSGIHSDIFNLVTQWGGYEAAIDRSMQRRKSGQDNFSKIGIANFLSAAVPAFLVYGPQDLADGEMAGRMTNKKAALYFAAKGAGLGVLAIAAATAPHDPQTYGERGHLATLPLVISEAGGLGAQIAVTLLKKLDLAQPVQEGVEGGAALVMIALGAGMVLGPRVFISGKATSQPGLTNGPLGEDFDNRLDPDAIAVWAKQDGIISAGARIASVGLGLGSSTIAGIVRRHKKEKIAQGAQKAVSQTTDGSGKPVNGSPLPLITRIKPELEGSTTGASARLTLEGNFDLALAPGASRGRLDTQGNRNVSALEELQGELGKLEVQLRYARRALSLTDDEEKDPGRDQIIKAREARVAALTEKVESLKERIGELEGKSNGNRIGKERTGAVAQR